MSKLWAAGPDKSKARSSVTLDECVSMVYEPVTEELLRSATRMNDARPTPDSKGAVKALETCSEKFKEIVGEDKLKEHDDNASMEHDGNAPGLKK